jgi:hypothetical protein
VGIVGKGGNGAGASEGAAPGACSDGLTGAAALAGAISSLLASAGADAAKTDTARLGAAGAGAFASGTEALAEALVGKGGTPKVAFYNSTPSQLSPYTPMDVQLVLTNVDVKIKGADSKWGTA